MSVSDSVVYDSFNFGAHGIVITNLDHLKIAKRNNQLETIAGKDGAVLVQSSLGVKSIVIEGYYIGDTIEAAQEMYDMLAAVFNRSERPLELPHAGSTRNFTATPETVILSEPDGLQKLTFSVEFVIPKGHAKELDFLPLLDTNPTVITNYSATAPLTVLGSVRTRPLLTIVFTSVTGGTGKTVYIRNARDLIGLEITRDFVSGDIITIDSEKYQLYVNGVLTNPVGRFPSWEAGTGALFYSDTFTNRSISITGNYKRGDL